MGAAHVIAIDSDPEKLHLARLFGATSVILPEADVVNEILEITGGRGVDAAIVTSGDRSMLVTALLVLRPGGSLSGGGVPALHRDEPSDAYRATAAWLPVHDHTMAPAPFPADRQRLDRLVRLAVARRIGLAPLVSHVFPWDQADRAYHLLASGKPGVLIVGLRME
jgi:threonine dehydrogenase-like Zn-dependent dehydrogenase